MTGPCESRRDFVTRAPIRLAALAGLLSLASTASCSITYWRPKVPSPSTSSEKIIFPILQAFREVLDQPDVESDTAVPLAQGILEGLSLGDMMKVYAEARKKYNYYPVETDFSSTLAYTAVKYGFDATEALSMLDTIYAEMGRRNTQWIEISCDLACLEMARGGDIRFPSLAPAL